MACLLVVLGCGPALPQRPAPTPEVPAAADGSKQTGDTLPAQGGTRAARSAWRQVLHWPDDCEEAFAASAPGDDGGLEFHRLPAGASLVAVLCAGGAYQPSFRYYVVDAGNTGVAATSLEFPSYVSPDGETLTLERAEELWGEPKVLPERSELVVLQLSRQTADCGTWSRYKIDDGRVGLRELRVRLPCPSRIGTPVEVGAGRPPAGWRRIDVESGARLIRLESSPKRK